MDIDQAIRDVQLSSFCNPQSGDCLSVAVSIAEVFGGEVVLATETPGEGFNHAAVEKDGKLYDGSGKVGWGKVVDRFIPPEAKCEELDAHFYYPDDAKTAFPPAFDMDVYSTAKQRLKAKKSATCD